MNYQLEEKEGHTILVLSGEIDLHYSPELRKVILSVLNKKRSLTIDLENVGYLDSSGVACFVEGFQTSKRLGLKFKLCHVSESAMQVFKLARLDLVFPIE